jgi:hypothetical protein
MKISDLGPANKALALENQKSFPKYSGFKVDRDSIDSFTWKSTPEGHKFWWDLYSMYATETVETDRPNYFDTIVESTLQQIKDTLITKGKEYRRNRDVFHNFNEGAKRTGQTPEQVLQGFVLKHEISVNDMIQDIALGIMPTTEAVNEKMNDILVYNLLLKGMLLNRVK